MSLRTSREAFANDFNRLARHPVSVYLSIYHINLFIDMSIEFWFSTQIPGGYFEYVTFITQIVVEVWWDWTNEVRRIEISIQIALNIRLLKTNAVIDAMHFCFLLNLIHKSALSQWFHIEKCQWAILLKFK